jgi:dUTP pyrophosphatase
MITLTINVVNKSGNALPEYATAGAAGMDIRADIEQVIILQPLERTMVPTGIFIEVPEGYEAQIRPRSGLAVKQGITCLNTPGTIDSDYRGEIKVILINLSNTPQQINNGDRIAQMVFAKVERARFFTVTQLEVTTRGTGGFGHTGVQ